ncbi:asparagine synthase (glutamine-hydrolyzing) [Paucibacter oligotrophus]|uniref:asparagine synthase (glutamine-hydrolyzing) n=1 Tax=Roseateles oligotrophus TaxID=1769250 RepID=A0A840L7I1_9BURK|nr:asparagine synthase C-terminal domain-containing protein [Roseateles oligotrophus]MBB4844140.1 asparagine synthase (glutamine-hydrolyzing) [Roseateles oligotrophus]
MTALSRTLLTGSPRFGAAQLAQMQEAQGSESAWRQAFEGGANPAQALAGIQGSFALGLDLADGRSVLAVDRFAIETLCYRVVGNELRFASRADELAEGAEIDPQAIYDYLYFHVIPAPRTIFKDVFRLPAGHFAVFSEGKLSVQPFWTPDFQPLAKPDFGTLKSEFLQALADSVQSQLDGSKPACFLSGGTDSSTIAGMLARVSGPSGQRPASYSIGFEAEGYDEMAYARLAAKHFQTEHHEYYVTPQDLVQSIPLVAGFYDQPFGNSSALPAYYCAKMAKQDGVTKILAGDGGDELFGGNTRYAKQKVFGVYEDIPAGLRAALVDPLLLNGVAEATPLLRKASSYVRQAKVPMPDRLQTYNLLERLGVAEVLSPAFLASVNQAGPQAQQAQVWAAPKTAHLVDRMLAFDWRYTLAEADLPKVRGTTQLAGLSVGFPMLDERMLAIALKLPGDYKLKGLKLRWFFKEALRGFLPDEIITKKKQGFGLPFGVWATRHAELKALAAASLESLVARGLVNQRFVRQLLDQRLAEHPGYYGEMLWILMMLAQWLQKHAPGYKV